MPHSGWTPDDINVTYTSLKSAFNGLQFRCWQDGSISIRLAVIASKTREMSQKSQWIWPYSSSRSSKVIDLGVNGKPICDFLLVISCNLSRICYGATVFEIFRLKDWKLLILPTPPLFDAPARGDPFQILWWNLASENYNRGATRWWRNHDASFLRFDTLLMCDGRTDRQTDGHVALVKTCASIASRG